MTLENPRAQGIEPRRDGTLTTFITPEPQILINAINIKAPTSSLAARSSGPAGVQLRPDADAAVGENVEHLWPIRSTCRTT